MSCGFIWKFLGFKTTEMEFIMEPHHLMWFNMGFIRFKKDKHGMILKYFYGIYSSWWFIGKYGI